MINQAYISGQIGRAIYEDDKRYFCLSVENLDKPFECRSSDISLFWTSGSEISSMTDQNIDLSKVQDFLENDTRNHRALTLCINGFNRELSKETRLTSIEAIEELFSKSPIESFVRARLLARVLPNEGDLPGAISVSR